MRNGLGEFWICLDEGEDWVVKGKVWAYWEFFGICGRLLVGYRHPTKK